jgi:RNA polymerase sigma-70 factor, ECF subfamily
MFLEFHLKCESLVRGEVLQLVSINCFVGAHLVDTQNRIERFVQLQTNVQGRLYAYIRTLVPDPESARDVLQETNLVLWRKSAEFVEGTSFDAWCSRVAYFQAKTWLRDRCRDRHVFSDALLQQLSSRAECQHSLFEERQGALHGCLEKLPQDWREIVRQRYTASATPITVLAEKLGRTSGAVRKVLHRAHRALLECIQRSLSQKEHP